MRILIINPNTSEQSTQRIGEAARRAAAPDTQVECISAPYGTIGIDSQVEGAVAAVAILEELARSKGRCDGVILAGFGDYGLTAARELMDVPVIGMRDAACALVTLIAQKFSVISARITRAGPDFGSQTGLALRLASIRAIELSVPELGVDMAETHRQVLDAARTAIAEDGAEAILLGAGPLSGMDRTLQEALKVPVIDGVAAGVRLLEALHALGLTTSKARTFAAPSPKTYRGESVLLRHVFGNQEATSQSVGSNKHGDLSALRSVRGRARSARKPRRD